MIRSIKIVAVNKPHGTMTVMFNEDQELEWNFPIPTDDDENPIEGDAMLKILIAQAYDAVVMIYKKRAEEEVRRLTDFSQFNKLKRRSFGVKAMVAEYEQAREGQEEIEDLPPQDSGV